MMAVPATSGGGGARPRPTASTSSITSSSGGGGLLRKRGTSTAPVVPVRRRRRRTPGPTAAGGSRSGRRMYVSSLHANLILTSVVVLGFACILWTYVLLTSSGRVGLGVGGGQQHQTTWKDRRRRANDPQSIARNRQRLIQRRIDQRIRAGDEGYGGGRGGWEGYARRRQEDNGIAAVDEIARRYHDTRDATGHGGGGLYERINRRRRAYFERDAVDDDQFHVGGLHLPTPVIIVGMPKSGTTSIFSYFKCGGQRSSHFACNNHYTVNDDPDRMPVDVVEAEPWRNCRLPAGAGGGGVGGGSSGSGGNEDGSDKAKQGLNIDTGNFPRCSVCVERNALHGRPPLEGCGAYDIWAELDSAEHPLPSLLAKEVADQKEREAKEIEELMAQIDDVDEEGSVPEEYAVESPDEDDAGAMSTQQPQEQEIAAADVRPLCSFPQITRLQEIHNSYPNATFILNLRPVGNWIRSVSKWAGDRRRTSGGYLRQVLAMCDLPGFPSGVGKTDDELRAFYESHTERIRNFVQLHPSHSLVEVNIEEKDAGLRLEENFGVSHHCWKERNANPEKDGVGDGQGQRALDAYRYSDGAKVLGERQLDKSRRRRERPKEETGGGLRFRPATGGRLRATDGEGIHKRRERPLRAESGDEDPTAESEAEEKDETLSHTTREERQRGMRERLKKRIGVLDTWRDRHNYPVCENIDDIFPESMVL